MKGRRHSKDALPAPDSDRLLRIGRRLWPITVSIAVLFVGLAVAFGYLVMAGPTTVDSVVIVTVPSGADIEFDGKSLGPSPIRIDGVRIGPHAVRVSKDGFSIADRDVTVYEDLDDPIEIELKPVAPLGSLAKTPEQQIQEFIGLAEDAFDRGEYVFPGDRSAFYYTEAILAIDRRNIYANEMRVRIRQNLLSGAILALDGRDLTSASRIFSQLQSAFPGDPETAKAVAALDTQLKLEKRRLRSILARARQAYRSDRLLDPPRVSAYDLATEALTIDPSNEEAQALLKHIKERELAKARALASHDRIEQASRLYRQLSQKFPDDRSVRGEQRRLLAGKGLDTQRARRDAGLAAFDAGNYSLAIENLSAAADLGAADAVTHTSLGLAYLRTGQPAKARRELERSVVQNPSQPKAFMALAEIAERSEDFRRAAEYLRRAERLGADVDEARHHLSNRMSAKQIPSARP